MLVTLTEALAIEVPVGAFYDADNVLTNAAERYPLAAATDEALVELATRIVAEVNPAPHENADDILIAVIQYLSIERTYATPAAAREVMPTGDTARRYQRAATAAKGKAEDRRIRHRAFLDVLNLYVHPEHDTVDTNDCRDDMAALAVSLGVSMQSISAYYGFAAKRGVITLMSRHKSTDTASGNTSGDRASLYQVNRHLLTAFLADMDTYIPDVVRVRKAVVAKQAPEGDALTAVTGRPIVLASQQSTSVDTTAEPSEKVWTGQSLPTLGDDECSLF